MKAKSYEEAMERLRVIVEKLEAGEETMDASLKLFEEGSALTAYCYQKLQQAEEKITVITQNDEKIQLENTEEGE